MSDTIPSATETQQAETPSDETFEIKHRWDGTIFNPIRHARKGTPRARTDEVRAKLVHTSHQSRRIEIFITADLVKRLGWIAGGTVAPSWAVIDANLLMTFTPAHHGLRVQPSNKKTTTCRIAVSGEFIAKSQCARVRPVEFMMDGGTLLVTLPREWASDIAIRDAIRASANGAAQ